jgi:hypothetical protein
LVEVRFAQRFFDLPLAPQTQGLRLQLPSNDLSVVHRCIGPPSAF